MGQAFASLVCLLLGLAAVVRGTASLASLQSSATLLQETYAQEYRLRQCGAKAAAAANLIDSARFIALHLPAQQVAADRAAAELVDMLGSAHGPSACISEGPWPLAVALHRQQHRRQEITWPNWVARLVHARP